MIADLKSLAHSTLAVPSTRGVLCRARQRVSSSAVKRREPGRERPPSGALVAGPAPLRGGSLTPRQPVRLAGQFGRRTSRHVGTVPDQFVGRTLVARRASS